MLEYQNKALASLVKKHKRKIDDLTAEAERSAAERVNLEANLAFLASKLITVSIILASASFGALQTPLTLLGNVDFSLVFVDE